MMKLARAKLQLKTCVYSIGKGKCSGAGAESIHGGNCEKVAIGVQGSSLHVNPTRDLLLCRDQVQGQLRTYYQIICTRSINK